MNGSVDNQASAALDWRTGLCSVTFRQLAPEAIVSLASMAGLDAIEWGSDVHAPAGDTTTARRIAAWCADAGLACPTLGSYARASDSPRSQPIDAVLDTAEALGVRQVRVWAGEQGFHAASVDERQRVAEALHRYADAAGLRGLGIALEYHPDTLTDCHEGAHWLLENVVHPALSSYWQPVPDQAIESCRADLTMLGERLSHVHVFHWRGERVRYPLSHAVDYWSAILAGVAVPAHGHLFLEFVPNDAPERLPAEAAALRAIVDQRLATAH